MRPFVPETVKTEFEAEKFKTQELKDAVLTAMNQEGSTGMQKDVDEAVEKNNAHAPDVQEKETEHNKRQNTSNKREKQPAKTEENKEAKATTSSVRGRGSKRATTTPTSGSIPPLESDDSSITSSTTRETRNSKGKKDIKEEESKEAVDDLSSEEQMVKAKPKEMKANVKTTKKKATTKSSSKRKDTPKRTRTAEPETSSSPSIASSDRKRRRTSATNTSSTKETTSADGMDTDAPSTKSQQNNGEVHDQFGNGLFELTPRQMEKFKKTKDFMRVYQLRHRLQKFVHKKKPGEIPESDYVAIASIIKDIEREGNMTINLLKYTKIGKVIKFAAIYDYGKNDKFNISERCHQLMKDWKHLIVQIQRETALRLADQQRPLGAEESFSSEL